LGEFAVPQREGQTEEDILMDIFDLHCPRHFGSSKMPQYFLEPAMPLAMAASPLVISRKNPFSMER
jgi:hypothetical protein